MSYWRPVLRPVTCSSRTAESSTPCSGEFSSKRRTGLLILIRASGGTLRATALAIRYHLLQYHTTLHRSAAERPGALVIRLGGSSHGGPLAPGAAVPVDDEGGGVGSHGAGSPRIARLIQASVANTRCRRSASTNSAMPRP